MSDWSGRERCVVLGEYLLEHSATVRVAAQVFGISKSTVHKDVTDRLRHVNNALWMQVQELLNKNKQERHLRGGEATRKKYTACRLTEAQEPSSCNCV
ncbi:MAG: sporulation transcriptional regulator SpoIIID [Clostridia bacterium]|nr:sporulation transcriptional regulator SpoIIID [Clostridia bacterium]